MRILLGLLLLVFQVSTAANTGRLSSIQILFGSLQSHIHDDDFQDLSESSGLPDDHEFRNDPIDLSYHEHTHRHSPEESDHNHSHSHNHFGGNCQVTCLLSDVAFNLIPFLDPDLVFPLSDDIVAQSPFLSSVFRPPIV